MSEAVAANDPTGAYMKPRLCLKQLKPMALHGGLSEAEGAHGTCTVEFSAAGSSEALKSLEPDPPQDAQCLVLWPFTADTQYIISTPPVEESVITQPEAKQPAHPMAEERQTEAEPTTTDCNTLSGCSSVPRSARRRHTTHNARWGYHARRHSWKRHKANSRRMVWQPRGAAVCD